MADGVRRFRHHPLVGTTVDVTVDVTGAGPAADATADHLDDVMVAEMVRLERVCSVFDHDSELERWKRDEVEPADLSPDFCRVMAEALALQLDTGGAFNPLAGVLSAAWRDAAAQARVPDRQALTAISASIAEPRYEIDAAGRPVRLGDCTGLQLNAFAKGWIVDRAIEAGSATGGADAITVNAGGDLAHWSRPGRPHGVLVAVENPLRPYDNEPPLMTIELDNAGLATSGRARQGVRIEGRWFSHVIDPRTGWPVDGVASVSVVAPSAGAADAMATLLGVLDVDAAIAEAGRRGLACLIVTADGGRCSTPAWDARVR